MERNNNAEIVNSQYDRMKGAPWFPFFYKRHIMILGQGGIGSWLSLFVGRLGCNLHIFDMDKYEDHNLTGQFARRDDIGRFKVDALKRTLSEFSPDTKIDTYRRYDEESPSNEIVLCGFDNMKARKIAFEKWVQYISNSPDKSICFFQDGRLLAEQLQIFNIPGDNPNAIMKYKEYLFEDSEVDEENCVFKQTSHCAAMIAAKMVGFLTNWAGPMKRVPSFHEYVIPLNYTKDVNF